VDELQMFVCPTVVGAGKLFFPDGVRLKLELIDECLAAQSYKVGKITAVPCHATCMLLKAKVDGKLLVEGKTWTGFASSEERYAGEFVGKRIQPFWIEEEAKKLAGTNFIVAGRFKAHALRDGNLITGQQQYSGTAVARLVIEALGI